MADVDKTFLPTSSNRPGLLNSPKGLLDLWMKENLDWMESCIPAIFLGYQNDDRNTGYAIVQPLVKIKTPVDTVERGKYLLPIHHIQHGTFMVDAPLVKGDTGWIVAGDRDNTNVLAANSAIQGAESGIGEHDAQGVPRGNQGPQEPTQRNTHRFLYGFFLPDKWGGVPLPEEFKDSLVIGQVNPDASSYGRFVMDPDGTIHVLSKRWYDAKEQKLRGGAIFVDLSWKGKLPTEPVETWRLGENNVTATEIIWGNLVVREWEDPDGYAHGGSIEVQHNANVGGTLTVENGATVSNGLSVDGDANINGNVLIKDNTSRTVSIKPSDLKLGGNAHFREMEIVTGKDFNRSHNGKVYLSRVRTYVLANENVPLEPVEISGVGGGGSGEMVVEPYYMRRKAEGSNAYVCYLPSYSLWYNGKEVSIHAGDPVEGDWYQIDGATSGDTVFCHIFESEEGGEYFAQVNTDSEMDAAVAHFAVAEITGAGEGIWEGVKQLAAGAMVITEYPNAVPFDLLCYMKDGEQEGDPQVEMVRVQMPVFYWDGGLETSLVPPPAQVIEFKKSDLANNPLYLNRFRTVDGEGKLGDWQYEVDVQDNAAKGQDGNGGFSFKLYDFDNDGNVQTDYRHSFLELNGKVEADAISIKWHKHEPGQQKGDELAIKGWHTQKDVNGGGVLPPNDPNEEETDNDPAQEGGHVSLESMILGGIGEGYSGYQVVAREKPGGKLVYIPIGRGDSSGGDSSDDSSEDPWGDITIKIESEHHDGESDERGYTVVTLTPVVNGIEQTQDAHSFIVFDGYDGDDGVGIASVTSGTPRQSQDNQYTITPITVTLTDGTVLPSFDVYAKNGSGGGSIDDFTFVADVRYYIPQSSSETPKLQKLMGSCVGGTVTIPDPTVDANWTDFATPIAHSQTMI